MASMGTIEVCLLLKVCAVVLALLLMAGDVERNPGPTGKEGTLCICSCLLILLWDQGVLISKIVTDCLIFVFQSS